MDLIDKALWAQKCLFVIFLVIASFYPAVSTAALPVVEIKKMLAPDAAAYDYFGLSVAISGDYAIVGAFGADAGGTADAGAAYIFHRTGANTWDAGTKITASDAAADEWFGDSVAISGDYAIVGAFNPDPGGTAAEAAYIFHRTGANTWDAGTKITAPDGQDKDYFGRSVAISGDYAIVGAYKGLLLESYAEAAYIFHRTGANTWDTGTKITAPDGQDNNYFGCSVAISGDYAIVGAAWADAGGTANAGAAYIFHRTGANTWDAGTKINASDGQGYDDFGYSVAISGDYAIVGAFLEDAGGTAEAGAAYIFHRTGANTWDAGTKITASDAEAIDYFGSVAISGDYAIVGAFLEDAGGTAAGAAYVNAIGFLISPISNNTTEAGGQAAFTVRLTNAPAADVTFAVTSSDTTEVMVDTSSLTFTDLDWDVEQTVTVSVDDSVADGNQSYSIILGVVTSLDAVYNGLDPADVTVTNTDDEIPVGDGGGGICFIATAVYRSPMAKEVNVLKKVRDEYLLTNELGRAFVSAYYEYSPPLANYIAKHPVMRKIVRVGLYPVLGLSKWLVRENSLK
jgi:hypothetical protein